MLALMLMTPLLCIYANLMGIAGGFIVAISTLNVSPVAIFLRTQEAVDLTDFAVGLTKGVVFGWLVAVTGCLCGIQSGRSASAVAAATSAVVSGILAIIGPMRCSPCCSTCWVVVADASERHAYFSRRRNAGIRRPRGAAESQFHRSARRDIRDHGR
jgi:hypothetical protein